MNIISWNVNGIRACMKKGFINFVKKYKPHVICVQEIKASEEQVKKYETLGYKIYTCSAQRKGYSGVATFTKITPKSVKYGFSKKYDNEGRVLITEYDKFVLFNVYFPNGAKDDKRLKYKLNFYKDFFAYCNKLKNKGKNVIICGDYNTAHKEIDLENPKPNSKYSGFLPIERKVLDKIISSGYVDTFRHFNKQPRHYTWWTYKFKAREHNVGWRLDYFFATKKIMKFVKRSYILKDVLGSDHAPIGIKIEARSQMLK